MAQPRLQRPKTVTFTVPALDGNSRANIEKIVTEIYKTFPREKINCLQPRGNGAFLLTLANQDLAAQVQESGLPIFGKEVEVSPIAGGVTYVTLTDLPYEVSHDAVRYAFSFYGEVKKVTYVTLGPAFGNLPTGDRKIAIVMKKPVPNILNISGFDCYAWYRAVKKMCRKCGNPGHLAATCTAVAPGPRRCSNCGNRWHSVEDCKGCFTCKTEAHATEDCPVKQEREESPPPTPDSPPPALDQPEAAAEAASPVPPKPKVSAKHQGLPPQAPAPPVQQVVKAVAKPSSTPGNRPEAPTKPVEPTPKKQKKVGKVPNYVEDQPDLVAEWLGDKAPSPDHPFYAALDRLKATTTNCTSDEYLCDYHDEDCFTRYQARYIELVRQHFPFFMDSF